MFIFLLELHNVVLQQSAEMIRERRRRRLEAAGLPFEEPPQLPPDYDGRRLSIAEILRARRAQRLIRT